MVITRKIKLYPPNKGKLELILKTTQEQKDCTNFWIDCIRGIEKTNINELHKGFYREARNRFSISADLVQLAMFVAVRIARTAKKKRVSTPYLTKASLAIKELRVDGNNLGFSLGIGEYVWFPFRGQSLPNGKIKESKIKEVGGELYCFLNIETPTPKPKKYSRVMGVDLGLAKIATICDKQGRNTTFFRGEQLRAKRQHYYELRKRLRPKANQGNVYKLLRRLKEKEHNWVTTSNHLISRHIVDAAVKSKRVIAVENLAGITQRIVGTKKVRRMLNAWSFRQLVDFIKYKARLAGLPDVLVVDPRETSRTCPKCYYCSKTNRKSQERFKCNKCGYETNADRVGAINVARRATELLARPVACGQRSTALV